MFRFVSYGLLACVVALCAGCHRYRDVEMTVFDARRPGVPPLVDATIHVAYPNKLDLLAPRAINTVTDREGRVRMRLCENYKGGIIYIYIEQDEGKKCWTNGRYQINRIETNIEGVETGRFGINAYNDGLSEAGDPAWIKFYIDDITDSGRPNYCRSDDE